MLFFPLIFVYIVSQASADIHYAEGNCYPGNSLVPAIKHQDVFFTHENNPHYYRSYYIVIDK